MRKKGPVFRLSMPRHTSVTSLHTAQPVAKPSARPVSYTHLDVYKRQELCLAAGRHVLCEKAFTVNEAQARRVTAMAREKGLLLAEAIWTRYMPSRRLISGIIESGGLGRVHSLQANLGYPIWEVERMRSPQLAGGTLLDLGVYPINFALMAFGDSAVDITGEARLLDTGVDAVENITMRWPDGRQACLHALSLIHI